MPAQKYPEADWSQLAVEPDYGLPLPGGMKMLFRRIPAGAFLMGSRGYGRSEEPRHRVVIPLEFYLGKYVVTQSEYSSVAGSLDALAGLDPNPSSFKGGRRPVEQVSWDNAVAWLAGLQQWGDLPRDVVKVGLPSEAEWEYACRAGSETEYYNGDGEAALAEVGWFKGNSGNETHDVDERTEVHPAGLQGMHGNVWEWCQDVRDENAYRKRPDGWTGRAWNLADAGSDAIHGTNKLKSVQSAAREVRGGASITPARYCRAACRAWSWTDSAFGFRVCLRRGG